MHHFKTLDSLRFFLFLAVFFSHHNFLDVGHLGVLCFFVLSGFLLIPKLFLYRERQSNFFSFFYVFFRRRILRIFPLYFLYLFLIFFFFRELISKDTFLYSFFYLNNFSAIGNLFDGIVHFEQAHLWSLSVEEQMYVLLPFLIWFFHKGYIKFLLCSIALVFILKIVLFLFLDRNFNNSNFLINNIVYLFTPFYLTSFLIGGFFAHNHFNIKPRESFLFIFFLLIIAIGLFTSYFSTGYFYFRSFGFPKAFSYGYQWLWGYFVWSLLFGYLILLLTKSNNILSFFFNDSIFSYLGKISYGLYIFHLPVILLCQKYIDIGNVFQIFVTLTISIVLSVVSYEFYEKYFLKLK